MKGYLVGGTKTLWSHSSCEAPEFGYYKGYEKLFESEFKVGLITKIELEGDSCMRERVVPFVSFDTMPGLGRDDVGDERLLVESDDGRLSEIAMIMFDLEEISQN